MNRQSAVTQPSKITVLYERLSRDDELQGDSNSIVNQKKYLEDYAKQQGFANVCHFTDDGVSGTRFDRPGFNRMMDEVSCGNVDVVVVKDMSRFGRDYLRVGLYMETLREYGVRLIAINDAVDSAKGDDDFVPFRNIMNQWYARDSSRKVTAQLRARGMEGKHTTNHPIYGYRKSSQDKNQWIIDDEAANVVRRIYALTIDGKGPYEIARMLESDKVECPSYYLSTRGIGTHQSRYNAAEPYLWRGTTIRYMLAKPEYAGHTVNFRSYKESYRDKRAKHNPKENWVIFENTQEPIIDQHTWETAQKCRKTVRRTDTWGEANPLTGLLFCADCGSKLYNHRGSGGWQRDWFGKATDKRRPLRDEYTCSLYTIRVSDVTGSVRRITFARLCCDS